MSESISEGTTADEAFGLLADATRIGILRAIWELTDPADPEPVAFSAIREHVDADDPGRLNYHLNKLRNHFIRRTSAGYELRESGTRMVHVLISGTANVHRTVDPVEIDVTCVFCGAPTVLSYADGFRYLRCSQCTAQCVDSYPDGVLSMHELPPSGLLHRTPEEIHEADRIWSKHRRASVIDGICPDCSGRMPVTAFRRCAGHNPSPQYDEVCDRCGSIFSTEVVNTCEVCKSVWKMPAEFHVANHPAVKAYFYEHGIEFDLATYEHRRYLLTFRETLDSSDPLRIRIAIPLDSDELTVTIDEEGNIVEVCPSFAPDDS